MTGVVIVDYGMGNLASVVHAIEYLGPTPCVSSDPKVVARAERLVIPGVGAFCTGIGNLRTRGLDDPIREIVAAGRPLLGICLGMQMLMQRSFEFGTHEGLALIDGEVTRMATDVHRLPLPQIGWNETMFRHGHPIAAGIPSARCFYYINSYACRCERECDVLATYEYGDRHTAAIARDNVVGVQFHPEKSQTHGLTLLRNFLSM